MAYNTRHEEIVRLLQVMKEVSVRTLTQRLNVSEATIRKDLTQLEEQAVLVRTHGGAILAEKQRNMSGIKDREQSLLEEKTAIARTARTLLSAGETIFIDSGSTCALLAHAVKDMHLRVICHSVAVINELINSPAISLHVLGGSYRTDSGSFVGPVSEENVQRFQIETCFLGTAGFSRDGLFTSQNLIEARLKSEVLKVSRRRLVLSDHSKLDHAEFAVFARAGDIDILITDDQFSDRAWMETVGCEVLLAPVGAEVPR
ncbi:MAG: DeoR/GlpR transcriptional regulator [Spirochaetaceae bacterium]|nr:MAG: DeoR/GlpR transcriptional regulator [Spirochaetaceae bacterium]